MRNAQALGLVQGAVGLVQAAAVRKPGIVLVPADLPGAHHATSLASTWRMPKAEQSESVCSFDAIF